LPWRRGAVAFHRSLGSRRFGFEPHQGIKN
jgi:hypothetical protein